MKVAKEKHSCEVLLREIEAVLEKHGGTLDFDDFCLVISIGETKTALRDIDNMARCSQIPRAMESERLVIVDRNERRLDDPYGLPNLNLL